MNNEEQQDQTQEIMASKKLLREEITHKRNSIPVEDRIQKSEIICAQLGRFLDSELDKRSESSEEEKPFYISVYQAMKSEVSLEKFIDTAYARKAHVCFPCMTNSSTYLVPSMKVEQQLRRNGMVMREVSANQYKNDTLSFLNHPLKTHSLNDPDLFAYPLIAPELFNMIIVPLLAFDDRGNRMGYGGGNYDTYLPLLSHDALIIGVAFSEQRVERLPVEPHDIVLTQILSA